jgi:flagellar FliL protein
LQFKDFSTFERLFTAVMAFVLSALVCVAPAAAEGQAKPGPNLDGPVFINLPAIVLPIFQGDRVTRQAGLVLVLELVKGKLATDVQPNQPKLYDAFITDLVQLYEQRGDEERIIDPALVKQRLQETSDRVLGPGVVQQILIQQAFERRGR